jgi:hypothetical protein
MKPVLYACSRNTRDIDIARAMLAGFVRHGIQAEIVTRDTNDVRGDVAIAYGWAHEHIFRRYRQATAQFAYWDLGYWNRHPGKSKGGNRGGHHRLSVNLWDTARGMRFDCPHDRLEASGIEIRPRVDPFSRATILVCGMSAKAAGTHGLVPDQWERAAIAELEEMTATEPALAGCSVVFRPKPQRKGEAVEPLESVLERCRLVVSHHSNCSVDALIAGVPSYAVKGVGRLMAPGSLRTAALGVYLPSEERRRQLLADIAYAQWTPAEMRAGDAWEHIKGILA